VIFNYSDAGNFEVVGTMGILMMVITIAIVVFMYRFLGRDPTRSRTAA
jgi:uncharacterized membrane protein